MAASKQIFNDLNLVIRLNQHIEDVVGSDEATAVLLTKQTSFQVLTELDAIHNPDAREDAQFDHQRASFHAEADAEDQGPASHLPFHLQGDQEFNKASAVAERRALQRSEPIRAKVLFLWDVARGKKKAEASRISSLEIFMGTKSKSSSLNVIEEKDYMDLMLLIFKVLRDDFVLDLAQLQVRCDWEVDSHHGNALGFDQFFSAVFELVDLWTCDILEATYTRFLELLARRITLRVVIFLDDMKLKLALSDNFDDAVVVKAIPLSTIQKFASVAKVVEDKGVRTVGDLANADPQMVERERREYVERNKFSQEKIGAKLQHLLDSFQTLSAQFDPTNSDTYALEDMKLVRHHHQAGPNVPGGPSRGGPVNHQADPLTTGSSVRGSHEIGGLPSAPTSISGSVNPNPQSSAGGTLSRSNTRRLSIHDLSQAESGLINALRSAFLLEKDISINRKHDADAVREELTKFGVDPAPLSDPEAMDKYGGLYEMFVLRDGESIKTLAQTMLTQIKLELQAHGVIVDDDGAELAYDGFYDSVVASNGDAIVKDAQDWVGETVKTQSVASYIKADYYELKPLSQVALIGSQPGDDEFVSLLSNDEDEGGGDEKEGKQTPMDDAKCKNTSPIQRKPSEMRIKQFAPPPIQTSIADSGEHGQEHQPNERVAPTPPSPSPSSAVASPRRRSGLRVEPKSHEPVAGDNKKRKGSKEDPHSKRQTHSPAVSDLHARLKRSLAEDEAPHVDTPSQGDTGDELNALLSESSTSADSEESGGHGNETKNLIAVLTLDVHPSEEDDNVSRRKSSLSLKTSKPKSSLTMDTANDLRGSDITNNDVDREAQGVEFGYDDEPPPVAESGPIAQEIIVELVPKIPKIVIGTGANGTNIPVAARYIQLLGLGTVLTASNEDTLYQLLQSDDGKDVDLVCFDIGNQLDTAVEKLLRLQSQVDQRVILLGGDVNQPERTRAVADECLALGAIYFATLPINFPALRTEILTFFDKSTQPFIVRQRKTAASSSGAAAAAFKMASRSIGAASLFGMHDMDRKLSTPPSYANIAKSPKRKSTNPGSSLSIPTSPSAASGSPRGTRGHLPSLVKEVTSLIHLKALDDIRTSETTTALVPTSPRSLKSYKKASPRLSVALKKMMR